MIRQSRSRLALLVVFLAQGWCFAGLVSRVPALRDRFALDELSLGLVLVLVPLVAGVGSLLAGRVVRRTGVVSVLRVATLVNCVALVGVGTARHLPVLLIALAAFGLALGAVDATMNAYGVLLQQGMGRPLMVGFHAAFSLGAILGSVAAAAGAAYRLPLPAFVGIIGAVAGLAFWAAGRRLDAMSTPEFREHDSAASGVWRRIAVIGVVMTGLFLIDSAVSNWGTEYLRTVLGASDHVAALAYGGYAAAALLGRTVGDAAMSRFGGVRVVAAGFAVGATGLLLVAVAGSAPAALAGFGLTGCGLSVIAPQAFTAAGQAVPERPASAVAAVNICVYAGFVLGAPAIGTIAALASLRAGFAFVLVLLLALSGTAHRPVAVRPH